MRKSENCDMKRHVKCLKQNSGTFGNAKTENGSSAEQAINENLTAQNGEDCVTTDGTLAVKNWRKAMRYQTN